MKNICETRFISRISLCLNMFKIMFTQDLTIWPQRLVAQYLSQHCIRFLQTLLSYFI